MTRQLPVVDASRRGATREMLAWAPGVPVSTEEQDLAAERATSRGIELDDNLHNVLVLNYTMTCPLACDFCCYASGPRRTETMDLELALDLVDQAADLGVFEACSFTGGDPFVYHDDMLLISARMAYHGLPFTAISACAWATDDATVDAMLQPLVDNGLSGFTASHDPSHEKWVPREHISRVVRRCLELGVDASISGTFYDDRLRLEAMFPEFARTDVTLAQRPVGPQVGRLRHRRLSRASYPNTDFRGDTCYRRIYHDVTVFWDGEVYPCCSVYNRDTPGISYGNVYTASLRDIWHRIEGSLFLRTIKRHGFADLYSLIARLDPALAALLPDPGTTVGACHLCHQLMGDNDLSRRVHAVLDQEERRRLLRMSIL